MLMKYDVLIVGAGPSGLFCAYELNQKTNLRIAVLDAGKFYAQKNCPLSAGRECANCEPCATLTGEGGAAFFHAGKLSFYPAGSGLRGILETESACTEMYDRVQSIFEGHGVPLKDQDQSTSRYDELCENNGMDIKYYRSVPIERKTFAQFMVRFGKELRQRTDLFFETTVRSIERIATWQVTAVRDGHTLRLEADKLVIATGEYGFRWWKDAVKSLGVCHEAQQVDIGVRIECPSAAVEEIWRYYKDAKIKAAAPDGSELRTYCVLRNGRSVYCNYGDLKVLDGISDPESGTAGITIFNRLGKERLNGEDPTEFAIALLERFYRLHKEPVCVGMADFLGKDPVSHRFACTLPNLERLRYAGELPAFIHENLVFGIQKFSELIPGLDNGENCVLMPVIDNLWSRLALSRGMESSRKGLYVTGDATGRMRGIMQACVTGLLCADRIASEAKEV